MLGERGRARREPARGATVVDVAPNRPGLHLASADRALHQPTQEMGTLCRTGPRPRGHSAHSLGRLRAQFHLHSGEVGTETTAGCAGLRERTIRSALRTRNAPHVPLRHHPDRRASPPSPIARTRRSRCNAHSLGRFVDRKAAQPVALGSLRGFGCGPPWTTMYPQGALALMASFVEDLHVLDSPHTLACTCCLSDSLIPPRMLISIFQLRPTTGSTNRSSSAVRGRRKSRSAPSGACRTCAA